jgi:hypothetical protein
MRGLEDAPEDRLENWGQFTYLPYSIAFYILRSHLKFQETVKTNLI